MMDGDDECAVAGYCDAGSYVRIILVMYSASLISEAHPKTMAGRRRNAGNAINTNTPPPPVAMTQLLQAVQGARPAHPTQEDFVKNNKAFTSLGGYEYHGDLGTVATTEKWLRKCEAVFEVMDLYEVEKQRLAAHQLGGLSLMWWNAINPSMNLNTLRGGNKEAEVSNRTCKGTETPSSSGLCCSSREGEHRRNGIIMFKTLTTEINGATNINTNGRPMIR